MITTIPTSKVVRVSLSVEPTYNTANPFAVGLILADVPPTNSANANTINYYSDLTSVAADWASTTQAYKACKAFFNQSPRPDSVAIASIKSGETITDALNRINGFNSIWYGLTLAVGTGFATAAEIQEAAEWASPSNKAFFYTTNDADCLDASVNTDIGSLLKLAGYSYAFGQYDDNDAYAGVSAMARILSVNYDMQNATITLKFKQEPGVTPVSITETQRQALVGKNLNYYAYFGDGNAMLAEGVVASGRFLDEVIGLDWFKKKLQDQIFGFLYTRTTKVPQTDRGMALLVQQADIACQAAVNCGLIAPGAWNGSDLGEVKTGDFLPKGYYIYASKLSSQSQSDRAARIAPPLQIIVKGAGAIHSVDIAVTFEQ